MIQKQASAAEEGGHRAGHYLGLLEEHELRGGSLRAFAAERGLSVWTLYGWRRRLGRTRRRRSRGTSGLVAVDVVDQVRPTSEATDGFELILSDGCRVRVPANFAAARLAELIAVLRSC